MDASNFLLLLQGSLRPNGNSALNALDALNPDVVAGLFAPAAAAAINAAPDQLQLQATRIASLLVASESNPQNQHSSSGSWLVQRLRAAGCVAFGSFTVANLSAILKASSQHNGEYTSELVSAISAAGCTPAQWTAMTPAELLPLLINHAIASCRDADLPETRRLLDELQQVQLIVPAEQQNHEQVATLQNLTRSYPTGCATAELLQSLNDAGWQRWAEFSGDQLYELLSAHVKRAFAWSDDLISKLHELGATIAEITPQQANLITQQVPNNYRQGVTNKLVEAGVQGM